MKIGLALSGGGVRGVSHLGVIKALKEQGIDITIISGTSAGAIAGAFYCSGYSPEDTAVLINNLKLNRFIQPAFTWRGFLNITKAKEFLSRYLRNTFEDLDTPLFITATDVKYAKSRFFFEGPLMHPVLASSAIPVVFDPIKIDNTYYADGGILNNLPVEPLIGHCDKIIASHCNPIGYDLNLGNMRDILERSLIMTVNSNSYSRKGICDLFIEPNGLKKYKVFDFKSSKEIFEIGYEHTLNILEANPHFLQEVVSK
ncbi:MAG TPA: patatin-like phospholipase family protein [Cyclobacteriaceae bacterium]